MDILKKKTLFWDVSVLDATGDADFIIGRILNFGDEADFKWAMQYYGRERIKQVLLHNRQLEKKSLYFWCQYFNVNANECLSKQSASQRSAFWQK